MHRKPKVYALLPHAPGRYLKLLVYLLLTIGAADHDGRQKVVVTKLAIDVNITTPFSHALTRA